MHEARARLSLIESRIDALALCQNRSAEEEAEYLRLLGEAAALECIAYPDHDGE